MKLSNKTIIITGSSDGIGKAIAVQAAAEKCNLALVARNKEKLEAVAELARRAGAHQVHVYPCDLQDQKDIENTINQIAKDFDTIDILINNAGVWQKLSQLDKIEPETINSVLQTNLYGTINMTRSILPLLRNNKEETAIINVSSKSGTVAQAGQSVYTASKYGVRGFTEVLRADLKNTNIRIAGVYQAGTNTDMFSKTTEDFPVQKFTDPKDLANVIVYMMSLPEKIWIHDVRIEF